MEKILDCRQCGKPLKEHSVYNGLVEIKQTDNGFELAEDKILPVVPHICDSCGYVELYLPASVLKQ
ncbi:hypothetical protein [Cohnella sp. AR92]|uniref:hypothetical protein n=1 Tax=Cohnella sp. AR92 TaxID=648716 RepID=UPI000F8F604E|nr:hypothetical protein [Cohnella sp. AR92]RUS47570.1 hypothetical protein ELR57_07180 [Cohnella sp. AR92]